MTMDSMGSEGSHEMGSSPEVVHENAEISRQGLESASIRFPNLSLDQDHPVSPEIRIKVQKKAVEIIEGKSYNYSTVLVDAESEAMGEMAAEAEALKSLPVSERPGKLMEILWHRVRYAYPNEIDELDKSDPQRADWIRKNTGLNTASVVNVPLSQLIENGYGVCRHLTVAYLWLAQKAGLKGTFLGSEYGVIRNIQKADGEKLFKTLEIGASVQHSWVEVETESGKWMPVDPSTRVVGDSEEGMSTFTDANYVAYGNTGLDVDVEPRELGTEASAISFRPGQAEAEGDYVMRLMSTKSAIMRGKPQPPTNIPYSGEARMEIQTAGKDSPALNIVEISSL